MQFNLSLDLSQLSYEAYIDQELFEDSGQEELEKRDKICISGVQGKYCNFIWIVDTWALKMRCLGSENEITLELFKMQQSEQLFKNQDHCHA